MNPTQKLPPPPARKATAATQPEPATLAEPTQFALTSGKLVLPQRATVYGPGGIGKSSLCALAPTPVFLDIEGGTNELEVARVGGLTTFALVRECLRSPVLDQFETVVIDSVTKLEELVVAHVISSVPHEKGARVTSLEGYGFGKGYSHVYDAFLLFLADCDALVRRGKHVVLIAHDCVTDVPNPAGEDFIRFEPRLQSPKSGKASVRSRVVEWSDHVLFMGYDVVSDEGKGRGAGTRTIYTSEMPDHIAKSRRASLAIAFDSATDGEIWNHLLGGTN
jgi:hypothetical protein